MGKRITLIHAMPVSIPPILEAFQEGWPEAEIGNLLDDGLTAALQREGGLTTGIVARICDLAVFAPASASQFHAAARGGAVEVHTSVAAGALAALNGGDPAAHDRLVAEAAEVLAGRVDVICLDQFSMARARAAVQARVTAPVLTGPATAVARLKVLLNV